MESRHHVTERRICQKEVGEKLIIPEKPLTVMNDTGYN
jgi:hypothetical protein